MGHGGAPLPLPAGLWFVITDEAQIYLWGGLPSVLILIASITLSVILRRDGSLAKEKKA
jgi:hypothetical protein